jgi:hypothetical protein
MNNYHTWAEEYQSLEEKRIKENNSSEKERKPGMIRHPKEHEAGTKNPPAMNGDPNNPLYHYDPITKLWYPPSEEEYEAAYRLMREKNEAYPKKEGMYPYSSLSQGLPNPKHIPLRTYNDIMKERSEQYTYRNVTNPIVPAIPSPISEQEMIAKRRYQDNTVKYDRNVNTIESEEVNTKNWSFTEAYSKYEQEHNKVIEPDRKDMWSMEA